MFSSRKKLSIRFQKSKIFFWKKFQIFFEKNKTRCLSELEGDRFGATFLKNRTDFTIGIESEYGYETDSIFLKILPRQKRKIFKK
ncbi:hypothetical protein LEP1GSC125_0838 [Leptospira mayottensis 200901122]|uniref:Uncharacterized protein n=1 Tax=Leptospira mayottensis 200901122 TaxID=1193010 RepID=A0AA87MUS2_9LEPT|nr:hypothetical protein LEP1GSC125_0838 [Leptospira mayottensis 200901122]